jgi:anti-sigma B factor antagonist
MHVPSGSSATESVTQRIPVIEVVVCGAFDALSAPKINDVIEDAMALRPCRIVIDLADCPSIDAAGIMLLLDAHRRAMRGDATIALRSPGERLRRNLRLAHVDRVLQVIRTEPDELADATAAMRAA